MHKTIPIICPSCSSRVSVKSLVCKSCNTNIEGAFDLPILASLDLHEQEFIINFVKQSGSLKLMAKQMKVSYPTIRNILDKIIEHINKLEK
ncbi:MAG: DUF2089 family protein [Bacteroidia bacterium]|nr:DUF2089 family protein [Bacteroidia bacterium]